MVIQSWRRRATLFSGASLGLLGGLMIASGAAAQSASAPKAAADSDAARHLQEVVVTAERRSQSIQKAPLAITVRSGADLVAQGRTSVEQILEDVPGVNFVPNVGAIANGDTSATSISIRGIGSNGDVRGNILSLVPAVAEYVDGVVGGIGSSFDIDRVEVLRGPQGTLYGRSATAGVVNIHTKDPLLGPYSADMSGEFGNYNLERLSAGANIPLSDTFAVRVSGQTTSQDGYEVKDSGAHEQSDGRIKALYRPNDTFSVLLGAAYEEREFHSGGTQVDITPAGIDKSTSVPLGSGHDAQQQYWAQVDYNFGFATLTYIPAFRSYTKSENNEGSYATPFAIEAINHFKTDIFDTQELHLVSNGNGRVTWQTGLFYYDNSIDTDGIQTIPALGVALHDGTNKKRTQNIGLFAEGTLKLTNTTRITAGIRYDDTKIFTNDHDCSGPEIFPLTCVAVDNKSDAGNVTYKIRLEHDLAEEFLVYASVSSAFLPGDVAIETGPTGNLVISPYRPENLTSYEIGEKWRGLDNKLQLNGAAFFYDYGGFQQSVVLGTVPGPGNIAYSGIESSPARVLGAELEVLYRPTSLDTIEGNASLLDAEYHNKPAIFAASVAQTRIPTMKPFEGSLAYSHLFKFAAGQDLRLKAEMEYSSAYDTAGLLPVQAAIPSYAAMQRQGQVTLGNLYATWRTGGPITVSAYIRNVGDVVYKTKVTPGGDTVPVNQVELGAPRTYGVVLNAKF